MQIFTDLENLQAGFAVSVFFVPSIMETRNLIEITMENKMIPPQPGTFDDREDLIRYVRDFGASQGYVVTIKKSRKDRRVILGCDRGGVYRNRRKIDESKRKRKTSSRLINCPFEAIGKKEDDLWILTIKDGDHNHEALKDMSEHPYSRRFTEEEVRQIKQMTEAGVKPRQVLKALKQINPELQSTPRHLYNLKAKIRQGNLSEKCFKSWRPERSALVSSSATPSSDSKENNQPMKVPNFIGGKFVDSHGCSIADVINPATQEVVSHVHLTTYEEFKAAVSSAKQAFPSWKNTPITTRQRIMFKLQELIRRDIEKLAMNITIEQGKTLKGAENDVLHGLDVVEHACGMATLQMGEFVPNASNGIDTYYIREPLGVCAGICPFNFPAMIPLWIFPIAVTCGNTFVLKPCKSNPGASMILAAIAKEAGLPDGVLNIVHGTHDIIDHICDDDDIKAVSLVGSNTAGMDIYARAVAKGKRFQSNIGGKNHAIIMPDANRGATLTALVTGGFGAAGQRCMALNTAVFVGGSRPWEGELAEHVKSLKVNVGTDPSADLGPVITKEVKDSICRLVQSSVESGARLLLDGRDVMVPGYENGNFIGPTILCDVTSDMDCFKEEIFGPVLLCMQAPSLEEAISIVNRNRHSNGASIFTTSGIAARKFQNEVETGMVGINVPVAIPFPFSSFNESNASFGSDLNFCGKAGVQFYTQIKMVAQQWKDLPSLEVSLALPPSSETDLTGRGVSSAFPAISSRDPPNQRVSPDMHPDSQSDSQSGAALSITPTSEADLPNSVISLSMHPEPDRDIPSEGVLRRLFQTSETMYMPQTSLWTETSRPTSQGTEILPKTSHWIDASTPTSQSTENIPIGERNHVCASQRNGNTALACRRPDTSMALTSERAYVPASHDNTIPMSHRNDRITATSQRIDPTSGRVYMLAGAHLSDRMVQTFERNDSTLFSTSERLYMSETSRQHDHMGSTSQTTDVSLHPTEERIYMSTAVLKNDDLAAASQHANSLSERLYMSPLVQRNTSERLYISGASQRIFPQNSMVTMDEFPCQGASLTLPASQRI